jgi:cysteine synthase A
MARYASPLELIRETRVVAVPARFAGRARGEVWAQLDLALPGGMKDRVALTTIEDAEAEGLLRPGGVIVESSSGTMAEGLARVGAALGYRVVIVTDPRIDTATLAKLGALGAEVEIVKDYDPEGGWQSARLKQLRRLLERLPGAFWSCQYDNPSNRRAYAGVGPELVAALGQGIAAVVGSVGSGGSLSGVAASLRPLVPALKVVAVDAVGSVLFGQPERRRLQSGHGNSIVPGNIDYGLIDEVHWLADGEAFAACRELARRTAIFAGGSTGATWVVASWVAEQLAPGERVVAIFPDRGERYAETIYSDAFLDQHGLRGQEAAAEPAGIRYGIDVALRWSRAALPRDGRTAYWTPGARTTAELAAEIGLTRVEVAG